MLSRNKTLSKWNLIIGFGKIPAGVKDLRNYITKNSIPQEDIQEFVYELLSPGWYARDKIEVKYSNITGEWSISNKSYDKGVKATNTFGTKRINAYKIIEESLNLKDVRIFDYVEDEEGKKKPVLNKKETMIAQQKQDLIKAEFDNWIWKNPDRRERLTGSTMKGFIQTDLVSMTEAILPLAI